MRIRVCASEKGKPVVRRGRKAHGPPIYGRWPGCRTGRRGNEAPPSEWEEGADAISLKTQPYETNVSLIFLPVSLQIGLDPLWWTPESLEAKPPRRESTCRRVPGPATQRSSRQGPFSWPAPLQRDPSANSLTS